MCDHYIFHALRITGRHETGHRSCNLLIYTFYFTSTLPHPTNWTHFQHLISPTTVAGLFTYKITWSSPKFFVPQTWTYFSDSPQLRHSHHSPQSTCPFIQSLPVHLSKWLLLTTSSCKALIAQRSKSVCSLNVFLTNRTNRTANIMSYRARSGREINSDQEHDGGSSWSELLRSDPYSQRMLPTLHYVLKSRLNETLGQRGCLEKSCWMVPPSPCWPTNLHGWRLWLKEKNNRHRWMGPEIHAGRPGDALWDHPCKLNLHRSHSVMN